MKILYGVVGEGMGHAMRSRVVLEHLASQGHDLHVVASQRAVEYLQRRFTSVTRIHGLSIIYEENRVRRGKTLWANVRDGLLALPGQIQAYFDVIDAFRPDVVVSDFESWSYLYGKLHRLPVYSVDNIQMLNRCRHDAEVRQADRGGFEVARAFVKGKLPHCEHYLITTFYYPEVRKERTTLYPPILRPEILAALPTEGEHLLVYQTAEGHGGLAEVLQRAGIECRVYGMRRGITEEQVEGNLRYRPFSEAGFIDDLASARAVVAGGGFTLMSECVYLHKPLLATPVGGQFEQTLNAVYLEREGYGQNAQELDVPRLRAFLDAVPRHAAALERYTQEGNRLLLGALDGFLLGHP